MPIVAFYPTAGDIGGALSFEVEVDDVALHLHSEQAALAISMKIPRNRTPSFDRVR